MNAYAPKIQKNMKEKWEIREFENCINKVKYTNKILKNDFLAEGAYPIVSQEDGLINGFWNNEEDVFKVKRPIVIFGDHTRVLKYVDFDFVLGADCVKILEPIDDIDSKFLLYYLTWFDVPNLGYSRHYKLLKEISIPIPPIHIQEAIVKELDILHRMKELQEKQLAEYDNLAQSTFYSMFGDPIENEKGWEVKKLGEVCIINPPKSEIKEMDSETEVSFVPMANVSERGELELLENKKIKDVWSGFTYFADNDVLFAKITPCMENGKRTIAKQLKNGIGFGSTEFHVLRPKEKVTSNYIFQILSLSDFRIIAEKKMTGSAGQKRVPKTFLEQFKVSVPPLSLQTDFANRIEKIEAQKDLVKQAIAETQLLIDYTMDKYFG